MQAKLIESENKLKKQGIDAHETPINAGITRLLLQLHKRFEKNLEEKFKIGVAHIGQLLEAENNADDTVHAYFKNLCHGTNFYKAWDFEKATYWDSGIQVQLHFPLSTVFGLIYAALTDKEAFWGAKLKKINELAYNLSEIREEEALKTAFFAEEYPADENNRLHSLVKTIMYLAKMKNKICDVGIKNALICGSLNHVYPGVNLPEDLPGYLNEQVQEILSDIIESYRSQTLRQISIYHKNNYLDYLTILIGEIQQERDEEFKTVLDSNKVLIHTELRRRLELQGINTICKLSLAAGNYFNQYIFDNNKLWFQTMSETSKIIRMEMCFKNEIAYHQFTKWFPKRVATLDDLQCIESWTFCKAELIMISYADEMLNNFSQDCFQYFFLKQGSGDLRVWFYHPAKQTRKELTFKNKEFSRLFAEKFTLTEKRAATEEDIDLIFHCTNYEYYSHNEVKYTLNLVDLAENSIHSIFLDYERDEREWVHALSAIFRDDPRDDKQIEARRQQVLKKLPQDDSPQTERIVIGFGKLKQTYIQWLRYGKVLPFFYELLFSPMEFNALDTMFKQYFASWDLPSEELLDLSAKFQLACNYFEKDDFSPWIQSFFKNWSNSTLEEQAKIFSLINEPPLKNKKFKLEDNELEKIFNIDKTFNTVIIAKMYLHGILHSRKWSKKFYDCLQEMHSKMVRNECVLNDMGLYQPLLLEQITSLLQDNSDYIQESNLVSSFPAQLFMPIPHPYYLKFPANLSYFKEIYKDNVGAFLFDQMQYSFSSIDPEQFRLFVDCIDSTEKLCINLNRMQEKDKKFLLANIGTEQLIRLMNNAEAIAYLFKQLDKDLYPIIFAKLAENSDNLQIEGASFEANRIQIIHDFFITKLDSLSTCKKVLKQIGFEKNFEFVMQLGFKFFENFNNDPSFVNVLAKELDFNEAEQFKAAFRKRSQKSADLDKSDRAEKKIKSEHYGSMHSFFAVEESDDSDELFESSEEDLNLL